MQFQELYSNSYAKQYHLKEKLKLGDWKFFFLEDTRHFKGDYIVDGDKKAFLSQSKERSHEALRRQWHGSAPLVTKEDFKAYVRVQLSGITNMFDWKMVALLSDLTKEQIIYIYQNYDLLLKTYTNESKKTAKSSKAKKGD